MNASAMPLGLEQLALVERKPRAVTIGNFDGVHRGHQLLLQTLDAHALHAGLPRCALTFFPHPATVVAPERAPQLLTSLQERVALLRRGGADEVVVLRFDEALSRLSAESFAADVLAQALGVRHLVVGENFRFGNGQGGDTAFLRQSGARCGFSVEGVALAHCRGLPVSSSQIRRLLLEGHVARAMRLLGRPHALEGAVVGGRGVGSKQTVPTLNIDGMAELVPANGVYVTQTRDEERGAMYPSITNIGLRPTFDDGHLERTVETFVLGPLVAEPTRIRVEFFRWVRGERKFASPELLRAQILHDVDRAQAFHRRAMKWQIIPRQ
ncbi:MAG: riboflavin biosynthesis protein RibF [Bryobacterales bacterium]|nr:riboflavin biosynthesis protein RibF [Bryobacterales bacterium]